MLWTCSVSFDKQFDELFPIEFPHPSPPEAYMSIISSDQNFNRQSAATSQASTQAVTAASSRTAPRESIDSLTGVRILAALWVLVSHLDKELFTWFPSLRVLEPVIASGMLGVDLFFVLSGFIIAYNYAPRFDRASEPVGFSSRSPAFAQAEGRAAWFQMYFKFLWLRIARLYPVHLVTLLAVLGMYLAAQFMGVKLNLETGYNPIDFVRNLFLVHAWFSYDFNWNGPAWSISAEWFAYLLFPVFAVITARVKANWQLLATLAVLLLLPLVNSLGDHNPLLNVLHLLRITTEFLAGCFLYRLHERGVGSSLKWSWLTPLAGGLVMVVAALLWQQGVTLFWVSPLLALFVYGVAQQKGRFSSGLASSQMVFWGQVSYSLYMTHSVVRTVLRKALPFAHFADASLLVRLGMLGLYLSAFAGVAALTFLLVEEPARHWLRKKSSAQVEARGLSRISS
jgi:peptidoglycan/LPS O-acetylase OafA/YrhL